MIKYLIILPLVALAGCSKSLPVDTSVFEAANVGCKAYNYKVKSVYGKLWFPTFKEEVVVVCSKPDKSQDLILSLSFKGKS